MIQDYDKTIELWPPASVLIDVEAMKLKNRESTRNTSLSAKDGKVDLGPRRPKFAMENPSDRQKPHHGEQIS